MTTSLAFQREWASALHDAPEVAQTSAMLKIALGESVVTRNEDEWAQTVRDDVRLSAYPLALWLASSWWRLRWEPLPTVAPTQSWRMAHELRAAGYGYVWPRMLFASDGENVNAWSIQSSTESSSPVHYLTNAYAEIRGSEFERTIDDFVSGVIARLNAVSLTRTALQDLWFELLDERRDEELAFDRRLEAMLGFDPDEGPEALLKRFKKLIPRAGASAVAEIATVCASRDRAATLEAIEGLVRTQGVVGRILLIPGTEVPPSVGGLPAWERGRTLAHWARRAVGANGDAISDDHLCNLIGIPADVALELLGTGARPPLGIVVRSPGTADARFILRKRNRPGRRFEIARFLCDNLIADKNDTWLPASDEKTSRQKTQRAFAAEFLCPIDSLMGFLSDDLSSDAIDEAAEHFGVSTRAVETQLVNHGVLPIEILVGYDGRFEFPYYHRTPLEHTRHHRP